MKKLLFLLCMATGMTGCAHMFHAKTPGAFLAAPKGPLFQEVTPLDPRHALVYIYRPATRWDDEEVQAPTLFIDGEPFAGLKSGAYTWLEVPGGQYTLSARRPLTVVFLKTIFELPLSVEGGGAYYFRYSETAPVAVSVMEWPDTMVSAGPLQQVTESFARRELRQLRLDSPGRVFRGRLAAPEDTRRRWAPFDLYGPDDAVN